MPKKQIFQMPRELTTALDKDKEAKSLFDVLSPSHQKEYVKWIEEARKAETRIRRTSQTLEMLKGRKKSR